MMSSGTTPIFPDLKGKRVLVTGGSAGIGKATAKAFDANGCFVAVLGRTLKRLDAVAKQLKHGVPIVADLTKEEDLKRAVAEAIEKLGGLDILINNGGDGTRDIDGKDEAAFISFFKLHVTGHLTLIRAAEEELIKNKGAVVNISSVMAIISAEDDIAYGVAKAAQDKLTKDLAFKFAPKGVRINSVLPGVINTEAQDGNAQAMGVTKDELLAQYASLHAVRRVGEQQEIASTIVFLASNAASFITGVNLPVDGGATLGYWFNKTPSLE